MTTDSEWWMVEQFDESTVTVETQNGDLKVFPRHLFPRRLSEGDVLRVEIKTTETSSTIIITPDEQVRKSRLARSRKQVAHKSEWDKPGDIVL